MNEVQRLTSMFPGEEFLFSMDDWIQDFKIIDQEYGQVRGICVEESRYQCVYCNRHENIEDIFSTSEHEAVHGICTDEWNESSEMWDIENEHIMIKNLRWIRESFNANTYYSIIRGEHIKPKITEKYETSRKAKTNEDDKKEKARKTKKNQEKQGEPNKNTKM